MSFVENLPVQEQPEIVDPLNCQTVFADWIVTSGHIENVINVTLGTIDHAIRGSNELPRVIVTSRLRFSREMGVRIHRALGIALGISPEGAPSGSEPPPVPRNQIN